MPEFRIEWYEVAGDDEGNVKSAQEMQKPGPRESAPLDLVRVTIKDILQRHNSSAVFLDLPQGEGIFGVGNLVNFDNDSGVVVPDSYFALLGHGSSARIGVFDPKAKGYNFGEPITGEFRYKIDPKDELKRAKFDPQDALNNAWLVRRAGERQMPFRVEWFMNNLNLLANPNIKLDPHQ